MNSLGDILKMTAMYTAVIFLCVLDRIAKYAAYYVVQERFGIFPPLMWFNPAYNQYVAFGIPLPRVFMVVAVVIAIGWLAYIHLRSRSGSLISYGSLLMLVGAASNVFDRFAYGAVIDYIEVPFWPIFNLADAMITAGALCVIVGIYRNKKSSR